ncbi:MAG TPA: glycerol-3-phosphate acyltransferase, partial [Niabella sp.]|nr:glycerol-3-phosphate acyltransferase [Niabella sp.]
MQEILLVLIAYCLGSIPSAVWVSKIFFDIDIRDYGSGNAGATNTFRVLGPKWGTIVMVLDVLKGFLAVKLALFAPQYFNSEIQFLNMQLILGIA